MLCRRTFAVGQNKQAGHKVLEWRRGFGVVSFGKKQLPWVLSYIANQKEHHLRGSVYERLERHDTEEESGLQRSDPEA